MLKRKIVIMAIVAVMIAVVFTTCDNHTCDECDLPHSCVHLPSAAATCTTAQTCNACGATIVAALGHDWEADSAPTLEPTCLEKGEGAFHCARTGCDVTDAHHVIEALGHIVECFTGTCRTDCKIYILGEEGPGGGKIFYVADGQSSRSLGFTVQMVNSEDNYTAYYLEAAPNSSSNSAQWGAYGTLISGVTTFSAITHEDAKLIGNGRKDTQIIVTYLANNTTETGRAAQLASSADFGGKNDWYLPSLGELNLLYQNRNFVDDITTEQYWSSSQDNSEYAWLLIFFTGNSTSYFPKPSGYQVHAVRAF